MFCDILEPGGEPYPEDPRYVLKNNLKKASDMGYTFYVGPELEYFYFQSPQIPPQGLDKGGYFDLTPRDIASNLRRETALTLKNMGIEVECSHHEVAPSQHEIDLRYTDALTMADNTITCRMVIKEIALKNDLYATFMPKPLWGENGSGMHTHQSLFKNKTNAFFDPQDKCHLSTIAKRYIAGLLMHAPEFTLVTNQWINSYKRLVPGYEAPIYLSWALKNRSDLIRVPVYKPGKEKATRVELRSPDPACNPYLAFSVMLAAGLKGIEEKLEPPEPVEVDVYQLSESERQQMGIGTLPGSLGEAIDLMEGSELVRECLGEHVFYSLIRNKRAEWDTYRAQVTEYEIKRYLPIL